MNNQKGTLAIIICLLLTLGLSNAFAAEDTGDFIPDYIHLPIVEQDEQSPTGMRTTWSCVYYGSYPSSEVVDDDWNAVDDYALREGDLICDDALYARLEAENWEDGTAELDGVFYLRAGVDSAPVTDGIREQHYKWTPDHPWHYFRIQPIRWRVLDIQADRALLLADRMPDSVPFHAVDTDVTWEGSTLRSWLNGYGGDANERGFDFTGEGFIDRAFTADECEAIIPTLCENLQNKDYGTDSGADTRDRLFILSNAEVFEGTDAARYGFQTSRDYDDPAKRFTSTLYAKCMGAWWSPVDAYAGNSFWFMRTNGYTPRSVTYVCDFGYIYSKGTLVTCGDAGVLPAMWVDLGKAELAYAGEAVSSEIMHAADDGGAVFPVPDIGNPIVVTDDAAPDGSYTVWNEVAFGHYPQTEILAAADGEGVVDSELYRRLEAIAGETDDEVVLDDTRYLRLDDRWFRCDSITWRVLEVSGGTALLLADRCLDSVPYHGEYTDVFWEDSDLRAWLNGDEDSPYGSRSFFTTAFTEVERRAVILSDVPNASNYYFGTGCGSGTHDRVFILSEEEVFSSEKAVRYGFQPGDAIPDPGRRLLPTAYAAARGAWHSTNDDTMGVGFWILRTNGYTRDNVVYVGEKGYLYNRGIPVTCMDAGIVPAIRVRLGATPLTRVDDISSKLE